MRFGQGPDFHLNRGTGAGGDALQSRLGWRGVGQRIKSVTGGRAGGSNELSAPGSELVVEWLAGQVGADHGQREDRVVGRWCDRWRQRVIRRPQLQTGSVVKCLADDGQAGVRPRRAEKRDAERKCVGAQAHRHGECGGVEEVGKIGVGAEVGVELDRFGGEFGLRVN